MNEDGKQQATMVRGSNIGFVLGILVVVGLVAYLFRSGFVSQKFGGDQAQTPTPTPQATLSPVFIEDEPITLLEEDSKPLITPQPRTTASTSAKITHKPVDTALGGNVWFSIGLMATLGMSTLIVSKKLGA